ncbi:MAG: DNA-3-methyladenine glycosylase family protein [Candidatus Thorarchaeota archaeon]|jgi:N-glycosylase/DNA lyase
MRSLKVHNFDLKDTLECGQTFCWVKEGDGYVNADVGQAIYVEQEGDILHYEASDGKAPLELLFRLDDPIERIQKELNKDELMKDSIDFAPGLRVVSDPSFPCLISFLCSTRNNIPSIKRATQAIRKKYGPSYELRGKVFYGLPTPDQISVATVKELEAIGLAWRSKFITKSTESILKGEMNLEDLKKANYEEAHKHLQQLFGVGPKVADCVCLFSLGFLEAFPIDVWIERVIQKRYGIFTATGKSYAKKSKAARDYFGRYAGYAQEYLFYYSRSTFKR